MDKKKKEDLAEFDSRWNFEKTVTVPTHNYDKLGVDWEQIREEFNELQSSQGDLYMNVSKLDNPAFREKLKLRYKEFQATGETVIFHHMQIFQWFEGLANHLSISVGEAVYRVLYEKESLRETLDLGDTMNVNIGSVQDIKPKESKVDEEELQGLIKDE